MAYDPTSLVDEINRLRKLDGIRKRISQEAEHRVRELSHISKTVASDLKEEVKNLKHACKNSENRELFEGILGRCMLLAAKLEQS